LKKRFVANPQKFHIAGIALAKGEAVVTRDAGYAMIQGLKVLKYYG